jgi:hypothetical protein
MYNGTSWSAPTQVEAWTSVSCASASFCVAVDGDERATIFNGGSWSSPTTIDDPGGIGGLESVSCPSASFCVAVDGGGNAVTFDGSSWGAPTYTHDGSAALQSVSCPSTSFCVAVSSLGDVFTASPTVPPSSSSPPTIAGDATEGQTLTEAHGSWSGNPTSYAYLWEDCDNSGDNCSPIDGATDQTYTLTAGDAGSTIRVEETATNGGGPSSPATSDPTPVVQAALHAPDVFTGSAAAVSDSTATLAGTVDPNGSAVTDCELHAGTTTSYVELVPVACDQAPGSGDLLVDVTAGLAGLAPNTTYHYRFVAENAGGRTYGDDQAFTTPLAPPGSEPNIRTQLTVASRSVLSVLGGHAARVEIVLSTYARTALAGERVEIHDGSHLTTVLTDAHGAGTVLIRPGSDRTITFGFAATGSYEPAAAALRVRYHAYTTFSAQSSRTGKAVAFAGREFDSRGRPASKPVRLEYLAAHHIWRTLAVVKAHANGRWRILRSWPRPAVGRVWYRTVVQQFRSAPAALRQPTSRA